MAAAKKESLRLKLFPARSIEETGLDSASPHGLAMAKDGMLTPTSSAFRAEEKCRYPDVSSVERNASVPTVMHKHIAGRRRLNVNTNRTRTSGREVHEAMKQDSQPVSRVHPDDSSFPSKASRKDHPTDEGEVRSLADASVERADKVTINNSLQDTVDQVDVCRVSCSEGKCSAQLSFPMGSEEHRYGHLQPIMENSSVDRESTDVRPLTAADDNLDKVLRPSNALGKASQSDTNVGKQKTTTDSGEQINKSPGSTSSSVARSRWKRAKHGVGFINRISANIRSASTVEEMLQQQASQDDAGGVGAATFEGAKAAARMRCRGRKGMEGLLVRQDRSCLSRFQDFYVACLKMPISNFLVAVFVAPLALGLLFTPLYLLDVDGLTFNGVVPEDATTSPLVSASQRCHAFLNIFLYALSLSTTFGGAPVAARSPYCLIVANMNTLLAQFLFVFLSGAVFARMSQPSYPIRCSKKAIIKIDDLLSVSELDLQEKYRVFCIRLVLTGPPPCELVDVKVCLTFRIFVTLTTGYVFCSTHDLEVVRPEVSYLRYGLMVRHIIDTKSPVYGHTMDSLIQGDASFSLTVMGLERTSMQSVFHLEDYFVCDGDVIWDGDYEDFIHRNEKGERVLDHSRIDNLKPHEDISQQTEKEKLGQLGKKHEPIQNSMWPGRWQAEQEKLGQSGKRHEPMRSSMWPGGWLSMPRRRVLKTKSTSFTRADW